MQSVDIVWILYPMKNMHLIIRSVGERTEAVSKQLAMACGLTEDYITIVSEVPFESALRATYEAGIGVGKKWTMTLDADVLLSENAIVGLIEDAELMPSDYVQLEGRILDKITGLYRQAGHRIYRTELLSLALKQIPKTGTEIRPEFYTLRQMGSLGHPSRRVANLVGLHDFEQYYRDLYRKSFVHAIKHKCLLNSLIERCALHIQNDTDFLVILKGIWDGLTTAELGSFDKLSFTDRSQNALIQLGINEKDSLKDSNLLIQDFCGFFSEAVHEYPLPDFQTQDEPVMQVYENRSWFHKAKQRLDRHGPIKGSASAVGALLKHIGRYLDR